MAGLEQLEIHSKSYLVRWVDVKADFTISWSVQPHKKSINFGIFRHPGPGNAPTPRLPSATFEAPSPIAQSKPGEIPLNSQSPSQTGSTACEKLQAIGLKLVLWHGNCEANHVTMGAYDVPEGEGGMYALVFDNTFAKQFSKTVNFSLLTYPLHAAPQVNHVARHVSTPGLSSSAPLKMARSRPRMKSSTSGRSPSDPHMLHEPPSKAIEEPISPTSIPPGQAATIRTGVLSKRRRKRGQGYARRFFSLDYATATLSYYHDENAVTIRGSIPLSLAAVALDPATRKMTIDSGAEVWHLRAPSVQEFQSWTRAFEVATRAINSREAQPSSIASQLLDRRRSVTPADPEDERNCARLEEILSRIGSSRDQARGLAKDTDPKYLPQNRPSLAFGSAMERHASGSEPSLSEAGTPIGSPDEVSGPRERRSYWRRKVSSRPPTLTKRASDQGLSPARMSDPSLLSRSDSPSAQSLTHPDDRIHERCMELLTSLDSVVLDFTGLIADIKQRRLPEAAYVASRLSIDTTGTQEFFDAEAGEGSQLYANVPQSDDGSVESATEDFTGSMTSDEDGHHVSSSSLTSGTEALSLFPRQSRALELNTAKPQARRNTIRSPVISPPSLIGFLRKNVGKDLSTISMPVSANEPISLLQKSAEQLEYSELLDKAADPNMSSADRLLHVTAFAISSLAAFRVKERALRKPFNPMLGESYELIREDRGYRFICEKVSHRPVQLACQADSSHWSLNHAPAPTQKFWGKSAELITEGTVRITFHATREHYAYTPATCSLRNLIAGEKYIEPTGSLTVRHAETGVSAVATFKSKGMFSGRSEDVVVQTFDASGEQLPLGLIGRWTQSLSITDDDVIRSGPPLWSVGALVPDPQACYGFPVFTATLNEVLARDRSLLAPTDSRLRPDQRAVEEGEIDHAEALKSQLEDAQRARRRAQDEQGKTWEPRWFSRVETGSQGENGHADHQIHAQNHSHSHASNHTSNHKGSQGADGETAWKLKTGRSGYWESRTRSDWTGVTRVFDI